MRWMALAVMGPGVGCAASAPDADWPEEPTPDRVHFPCESSKVERALESDPTGSGPRSPRPLFVAEAAYPAAAEGRQGFVELRFTIDVEGRPCDVWVESAEPPGYFDLSALDALRRWRFEPAVANGQGVALTGARERLEFRPDAGDPPSTPARVE